MPKRCKCLCGKGLRPLAGMVQYSVVCGIRFSYQGVLCILHFCLWLLLAVVLADSHPNDSLSNIYVDGFSKFVQR